MALVEDYERHSRLVTGQSLVRLPYPTEMTVNGLGDIGKISGMLMSVETVGDERVMVIATEGHSWTFSVKARLGDPFYETYTAEDGSRWVKTTFS